MKNKLLPLLMMVALLGGCKKDNKDAPESTLSGTVVITGTKQPVGVRSNAVQLELWQYGYALRQKIPVFIDQDGTFSAKLFDGNYKLVRLGGAPWANATDSIDVNVKGSATVEVPVSPFFTVGNESFAFSKADTSITALFSVGRLDASKTADRVSVHIGLTNFTDATNQLPFNPTNLTDITPPANYLTAPVSIKIFLNPARYPDIPGANRAELRRQLGVILQKGYAFFRAAVRTTGVSERFYTQVKEVSLK